MSESYDPHYHETTVFPLKLLQIYNSGDDSGYSANSRLTSGDIIPKYLCTHEDSRSTEARMPNSFEVQHD